VNSYWSFDTDQCECIPFHNWDLSHKICVSNNYWDSNILNCVCDDGYTLKGNDCVYTKCHSHSHWDVDREKCLCDEGYAFDKQNICIDYIQIQNLLKDCLQKKFE
jgi:hypothetical protein